MNSTEKWQAGEMARLMAEAERRGVTVEIVGGGRAKRDGLIYGRKLVVTIDGETREYPVSAAGCVELTSGNPGSRTGMAFSRFSVESGDPKKIAALYINAMGYVA